MLVLRLVGTSSVTATKIIIRDSSEHYLVKIFYNSYRIVLLTLNLVDGLG